MSFRQSPPPTTTSGCQSSCLSWMSLPLPRQPQSGPPHTHSPALAPLDSLADLYSFPETSLQHSGRCPPCPRSSSRTHPSGPLNGREATQAVGQDGFARALWPPGLLLLTPPHRPASRASRVQAAVQEGRKAGNPTPSSVRLTSVAKGYSTRFTEFTLLCSGLEANRRRQSLRPQGTQGAQAKMRTYT